VIGNIRCPLRLSALLGAIAAVSSAGACSIGDIQSGIALLTGSSVGSVQKNRDNGSIPSGIKARLGETKKAFLQNVGQWDKRASFVSQHPGLSVWATTDGLRYEYYHDTASMRKGHVVGFSFPGESATNQWIGIDKLPTITQFINGKTVADVKTANTYAELLRKNINPGIDMRLYNESTRPRYDFIVNPGADLAKFSVQVKGSQGMKVLANGDLSIKTSLGALEQQGLVAYQVKDGERVRVPAQFKLVGTSAIAFKVGEYDHSRPLIIDPIVYGSYYGGDGGIDEVRSVTSDADAGVYLTGATQAPDFPILFGPFGVNRNGASDTFLAKLRGDAYVHEYSAYIGGSGRETGKFLALDPTGNSVWIAGVTTSADFPLAGSGLQPARAGTQDNFLIKFVRDAVTVLAPTYSTYYGGAAATEELTGFAIAPVSGDLVLSGHATAAMPGTGAPPAARSHYLARLNPAGTAILWAKFYGGTGLEFSGLAGGLAGSLLNGLTGVNTDSTSTITGSSVAIDASDNVLITGTVVFVGNQDTAIAGSPGFPTTAGVFPSGRLLRNNDVYIAKFDPNGNTTYAALLGGANNDFGGGICVDQTGNAYLTGIAGSFDFPRTNGTYGQTFTNNANVFVTKVSPDGSQILISTNLRTTGNVYPMGIGVSQRGLIFVAGVVDCSVTFPDPPGTPGDPDVPTGSATGTIQTQDPIRAANTFPGPGDLPATDGFINVLDNTAASLVFGTYIGGHLDDFIFSPFVDRIGDVWVMGYSDSGRLYQRVSSGGTPTTFQVTDGGLDAPFITALAFKSVIEGALNPNGSTTFNSVPYGSRYHPFNSVQFINGVTRTRDGFLIRFRLDIPLVTGLTLAPASVAGGLGDSSTGTVTISGPAPAEGVDVVVSLNSTQAASLDPNSDVGQIIVTIPPGATTGTFTITSKEVIDVTQVQVKSEYLGSFKIAQLTVNPWLSQLTLTPTTVPSGNQSIGRVTLFKAAIQDVTVALSTDNPTLISFPNGATVTIPAGQQSANFPIQTTTVDTQQQGNVSASFLGKTITQNLIVKPAGLASLSLSPSRIAGGGSTTGTVTLDGNAPSTGAVVTLSVPGNPANIASIPATVTVLAGQRTATFTATANLVASNTFSTIRATYNGTNKDATLLIDNISLTNFTITPNTIQGGGSVQGTVVLNQPAPPGGAFVTLTSPNPEVLLPDEDPSTAGNQVLVNANATTRTFNIGTAVTTVTVNATVSASRGGAPITRNLTITPVDFTISITPSSVLGGNGATMKITLTGAAPAGGITVTMTKTSLLPNPPDATGAVTINNGNPVVVSAGNTFQNFPITTTSVTATDTVQVMGTIGPNSHSANLQVRAPQVTGVTFTPSVVRGLIQTSTMRVSLDGPAPAGGATITITKSPNPQIANIPSSVLIPAGATFVDTVVTTNKVSRTLATNVSASYGGNVAQATLTVTR
jgi:hypothetical protein